MIRMRTMCGLWIEIVGVVNWTIKQRSGINV